MKLNITILALAASFAAQADTIAWWHFDECDPGTTAPANTVASDQAPTTYAHVYTLGDSGAMSATHENSGDYLPTYTKPFRGIAVYDPVSGTTRTNHAAMKFRVDRGGPDQETADSNAGRARFGGGLKFDGGYNLYQPLYGKSAITVEAFVCTTGGTYNLFAPIVGCLGATSWTSERFALYMRDDGTIAVRFTTSNGTTIWHDSSNRGKVKVNDGAWHHVAFTYDGEYARIYVDYALDKKYTDSSDRVYEKTGTIPTYSTDNATWIGGYAYGDADNGSRKFPGVIDEVRVSNAVLTPDQFLRMQPIDMDPDEIMRVSFTPDEYGVMLKKDYIDIGDMLGPNKADLAVFRKVSGAGTSVLDTETKAGAVMAAKTETDVWLENAASFYQETNDVRKANYVQMPFISKLISGSDGAAASYTVEFFYKTRSKVRGTEDDRQVLAKFGGKPLWNVVFDARTSKMIYVSYVDGSHAYPLSTTENVDDGKWHHVAVVVDGAGGKISFYFNYALEYSRSGTLPDIGSDSNSIFFAAKENGAYQWFDGWLDDIRVTRRALTPDEFLTTHPVGSGPLSLFAHLENDYSFTCASNAALSVTGVGEARTNGSVPTFVADSRGQLLLDGTNGTVRVDNSMSAYMDNSRIVFPPSSLYEVGSYTVEFWAKFTGYMGSNGSYMDMPNANVGILRFERAATNIIDWYLYQPANLDQRIMMYLNYDQYKGWDLPNKVRDGKWHHYAYTFQPTADGTKSMINMFYDYADLGVVTNIHCFPRRVEGHFLKVFDGSFAAGVIGNVDAIRFSRGVLDPSQFLARDRRGFVLIVR